MVQSSQLAPGMTISISGKLYRVESAVKVTVTKGNPFIKTKLRDLSSSQVIEKSFKPNQDIEEAVLQERRLEFLYLEGKQYLFLDIGSLEQVLVAANVVGDKKNYLKEGIEIKASFYGGQIFTVELPQFLELMVVGIDGGREDVRSTTSSKMARLETDADVEVPPFIEVGDIIKVDTKTHEYIQRV
jgi:elongation factor P